MKRAICFAVRALPCCFFIASATAILLRLGRRAQISDAEALPHGVFHPMQCGPCLSSGAGTLQGTDAGDGGLFISKSPVVLLDQPPQCAAVERPRYRRDLSLACLLGNMTLSDLNPVDEFHCMEFVPGFFIQWIICLLFQSIGAGFGEYLRIKSSGFSPYQAWRALRRLARDGNHRVAASPGRRA